MKMQATSNMRSSWPEWEGFLRRLGLDGFVAWFLEAVGPFTILGAQALHFGEPFLRPAFSGVQIQELANLLEESEEGQAFVSYLREKNTA